MEAKAAGLPVAASAVKGTPDLIENGRNGLLFALDNTEELKICLQRLGDGSYALQKAFKRREAVRRILCHRPRA
jgi:glycosyltransferase involved in cell wall biosynthesis